jgi:hypothetical protein
MTCVLCREQWQRKQAKRAQAEQEREATRARERACEREQERQRAQHYARQQAGLQRGCSQLLLLLQETAADAQAVSEELVASHGRWMLTAAILNLKRARGARPGAREEVIRRRERATLATAFDDLVAAAAAARNERTMLTCSLARALPRFRAPALYRHWEAWLVYLDASRESRQENEHEQALKHMWASLHYSAKETLVKETRRFRALVCEPAIKRLLKQHLSRAWAAWVDCIFTCKATRETVGWIGARVAHRRLARAFDCFAAAAGTMRAHRQRAARTRPSAAAVYEGTLI